MQQPDFLKTDEVVTWSWGHGNDVWGMFAAAASGNVTRLQQLVEKDADLIRCRSDYRTPLHFAVRENQLESARWLIDQNVDATFVSSQIGHDSPRQLAVDRGYESMVRLLDEHLKSSYGICSEGDDIADAIRRRDIGQATSLIGQHGIRVADFRGNKPIHWAAMTRQMNLVRFLLRQGADINAMRPDGAFALDLTDGDYWYRGSRDLHPEAIRNHWVMLGFMIAKGADYDMTTACRIGDIEQVRDLLAIDPDAAKRMPHYCTWSSGYPLRNAARLGHLSIVKLLLESGADPNQPEHGLAPFGGSLYEAVAAKHIEVVRLLLEHGANPNQEIESCECCLSRADEPTRRLLREHGAVLYLHGCLLENNVDDLAIHLQREPHLANDAAAFAIAAQRGHQATVDLLLKYEPDLWQRMPASAGASAEILSWMIEQGMNINQTNWLGIHALHRCVDTAEAQRLLDRGADVNIIDGEHQSTPLGWAARQGNLPMVEFLLANGADRDAAGADWAIPLLWAKRRGHDQIARLLQG